MELNKETHKKIANIDDVAREAGVSKATVSRVMNNPDVVNGRTAEKVRRAIKRLNYTPNALAQSMRSQRTRTIGVVVPDLKNSFYSAMLCEIEKAAKPFGYMLMICPTSGGFHDEKEYVTRMMRRRVDGVLYFTYNNSREHIDEMHAITGKLPFILMDEADELNVHQVVTDGYNGVMSAVDYLVSKGHKKIGCVRSNTEVAVKRFQGYVDGMKANGLKVNDEFVICSGFDVDESAAAAVELLDMEDRPTALICVADSMAVGVMKTLSGGGIDVPEDMEVMGFNNSEMSTLVTPALSTIGQNMPELAERAVGLMMELIDKPGNVKDAVVIKVDAELILRETTS